MVNRCTAIITGPVPGAGQCHGCPFKHQEANLVPLLQQTLPNITQSDIKEITKAAKEGHYHVSCTRVFEIQHAQFGVSKGDGWGNGDSVDHPNRYFDRSRQLVIDSQPKAKKEEESKTTSQLKKEQFMEVDG